MGTLNIQADGEVEVRNLNNNDDDVSVEMINDGTINNEGSFRVYNAGTVDTTGGGNGVATTSSSSSGNRDISFPLDRTTHQDEDGDVGVQTDTLLEIDITFRNGGTIDNDAFFQVANLADTPGTIHRTACLGTARTQARARTLAPSDRTAHTPEPSASTRSTRQSV